jgi:isochorismate hydrolase
MNVNMAQLIEDAERWRALINCARIRIVGSAGIVVKNPDGYAHLAIEIWTKHLAKSEPDAVKILTEFADMARSKL